MLSKFFLDRPVFAWVIAIFIMLLGGLAIYNLPISQYPPLAPPACRYRNIRPLLHRPSPSTPSIPGPRRRR